MGASAESSPCKYTTLPPGLIIPAFSEAIFESVSPRNFIWSYPMEVMTDTRVFFIILVASSLPPIPVSSTTISHFFSLKYQKARAVSASKAVGCGYPSLTMLSQASFIRLTPSAKAVFVIYASFTCILSLYSKIVGEIYLPTR